MPGRPRISARLQSPFAIASSDRSHSASACTSCAPTSSAMRTASSRSASLPSWSSDRMRARAWQSRATGVMVFAAVNFRTASSASVRICSTPRRHMTARSTPAQASVTGSAGRDESPYCQLSTMSAHRSASAGRPVSAASTAAQTAMSGYLAIPSRSSSHRNHRWSVTNRPCRSVGTHRLCARRAAASTSPAAMAYSSASSGRPLASHQAAARRRRTGSRPGSSRSSSASSMSRNRWW